MRSLTRLIITMLVLSTCLLASPTASSAAAGASTRSAAVDACERPLVSKRTKTYRFTRGARTLSFGRVVVTPTRSNDDLYCVRFQTGGRKVTHSYRAEEYTRGARRCGTELLGSRGTDPAVGRGYDLSVLVRDGVCRYEKFSIKSGDAWFSAGFMRFNR